MNTYPQKPPFSHDELEAFLKDSPLVRLGTHNPDGTIHIAPVYFKYEDGLFWLGTQDMSRKVRNIKRNPLVTLMVDNQTPPWKGVLVYGEAQLDYEDVIAKRVSIFLRYMPVDRAESFASNMANLFKPVIIRIAPKKMVSFDYSKQGWR